MNKYQKIVVIVAAVNIVIMVLFPPVLETPIARFSAPTFDGYHAAFSLSHNRSVYADLLVLQLVFVSANALSAWLVLSLPAGRTRIAEARFTLGIAAFAAVNLGAVLLFPPFESYAGLAKFSVPSFDGFYFAFGDRSRRAIFAPILYLEVTLVTVNALTLWVLFSLIRHPQGRGSTAVSEPERLSSAVEVRRLSDELRQRPVAGHAHAPGLGSGPDRRRGPDPNYRGVERRSGRERRSRPR